VQGCVLLFVAVGGGGGGVVCLHETCISVIVFSVCNFTVFAWTVSVTY
jgi:hypothetical protein